MKDLEIEVMGKVSELFSTVEDPSMRRRIFSWLQQKFDLHPPEAPQSDGQAKPEAAGVADRKEVPGIACLGDDGSLHLTVRDLKARSTRDAALRLAHVVIWAWEQLTGERKVSSRRVLSPILQQWRAYDGNTRYLLANYKGIIRDEDMLSLDAHAQRDAEAYVKEMLDPGKEGSWKPSGLGSRVRSKRERVLGGNAT